MSGKKDFTKAAGNRVLDSMISGADRYAKKTVSPEEREQLQAAGMTQGRKGAGVDKDHRTRVNVTLTDKNYTFIKVMSGVTGTSMAKFVNTVITKYQEEHPDILARANEFIEEVKGL